MSTQFKFVLVIFALFLFGCKSNQPKKSDTYSNNLTGVAQAKHRVDSFYNTSATNHLAYLLSLNHILELDDSDDQCSQKLVNIYQKMYDINPSSAIALFKLIECGVSNPQKLVQQYEEYSNILKYLVLRNNGSSASKAIEVRELIEAELILAESEFDLIDQELIIHNDKLVYKFHTFDQDTNQFHYYFFENMRFHKVAFSMQKASDLDFVNRIKRIYIEEKVPVMINGLYNDLVAKKQFEKLIKLHQEQPIELQPISRLALAKAFLYTGRLDQVDMHLDQIIASKESGHIPSALFIIEIMSEFSNHDDENEQIQDLVHFVDKRTNKGYAAIQLYRSFQLRGMSSMAKKWLARALDSDNVNLDQLLSSLESEQEKVALLQLESAKGNALAKYRLAFKYFKGVGVKKNTQKEFQLYMEAAKAGDADSMFEVAYILKNKDREEYDIKQAVQWYKKAIAAGNIDAIHNLGYLYDVGADDLEQDYQKAFTLYQKARASQLAISSSNLASMYKHGKGIEKDIAKAIELYKEAFNRGYDKAGKLLADIYMDNELGLKDIYQAETWYKKCAINGRTDCQYELGSLYARFINEKSSAVKWLDLAASGTDSDYITWAAYLYSNGARYLDQNRDKAVRYYTKAVSMSNPQAQANLGFLYEDGQLVEKDMSKALALYEKSAKQDYGQGLNNLATFYFHGLAGLEVDKAYGLQLWERAAEKGNKFGLHNLGKSYYYGNGVEEDDAKACNLFKKAANKAYSNSYYFVGNCYAFGLDGTQDYAKALYYYGQAKEIGELDAHFRLATLYQKGLGVEKDLDTAIQFVREAIHVDPDYSGSLNESDIDFYVAFNFHFGVLDLAPNFEIAKFYYQEAMQGNIPEAYNNLGELYRFGQGTEQDYDKAISLYNKTYRLGDGVGAYNLAELHRDGHGFELSESKAFEWMKKSAKLGFVSAYVELGLYYLNGIGTQSDEKKALYWLTKASDEDYYRGQYYLGIEYYKGLIVPQDEDKARKLIALAAAQGYSKAKKLLEQDLKGI
jgi:TPR repeat protein